MTCYLRLGGCALCAAALAGCACLCACRGLGDGALAPLEALFQTVEEGERLAALLRAANERNALQGAAAGDLAEGRLPLPAALRRLRVYWHERDLRQAPGRSADERLGWSLICWAAQRRGGAARRELLGRLEAQLRGHLREEGLPEPDPQGRAWALAAAGEP